MPNQQLRVVQSSCGEGSDPALALTARQAAHREMLGKAPLGPYEMAMTRACPRAHVCARSRHHRATGPATSQPHHMGNICPCTKSRTILFPLATQASGPAARAGPGPGYPGGRGPRLWKLLHPAPGRASRVRHATNFKTAKIPTSNANLAACSSFRRPPLVHS